MRRMLFGIATALASLVVAADVSPPPGGPFAGSTIDPGTYLSGKVVDFSVSRSLPYRYPYWLAFENVKVGNERLLMLMGLGKKGVDLEPLALVKHTTVTIPVVESGAIQINGDDSDWAGIPAAVTDAMGDENAQFLARPGTDLAGVYLARDGTYLYLRMTMHDGGPLGEMPYNPLHIVELQTYLLQLHTPGDIVINCSNVNNTGWRVDVSDRNERHIVSYEPWQGFAASGAGFIEWKVRISDVRNLSYIPLPYFPASAVDKGIENRFIRTYIHPGPHPGTSPVSDENHRFARPLIVDFWD